MAKKTPVETLNTLGDRQLRDIKDFAHKELVSQSKPQVSPENQICQAFVRGMLMYLVKNGYKISKEET